MAVLRPGGAGRTEVDHCTACRLVWFDALEFDALDRWAWVRLLQAMTDSAATAGAAEDDRDGRWRCPGCGEPLADSSGLTRHGRFGARRCTGCQGQALGLSALLASRGLLRPPSSVERVALAGEGRTLHCLSCGAAEAASDDRCGHCETPLLLLDLPRLALALGQVDEGQAARARPPPGAADPPLQRWPCQACGQVLDPAVDSHCAQCGHPVLAPALEDVRPMLAAAGQRLQLVQEEAMRSALEPLPVSEHCRIAAVTQRPEHVAAADRAVQLFWRRYGVLAAAFGVAALVAFCNAR